MFTLQIMLMGLRGLRANLLRSLLATLGVIIGVGAVISAMSILEGAQRDMVERFESLGSETITVIPNVAKSGGRSIGMVETLTLEDADWIGDPRNCPSLHGVAPEVSSFDVIKYFSRNSEVTVLGTNEDYAPMFNYRVAEGRFLSRDDISAHQKVVVLGYQVARDLFGRSEATGRTIRIKGASFRVIGVMEKKGNIGFRTVDSQVMIPITTAMNRLFGIKFVNSISAQAAGTEKVEQAMDEIKGELRRRHDIRFRHGQEDDFRVFSQEEQRRQIGEITFLFQVVLYSIALISLVVGGIGIMNIMLVSVAERTREIGIRKAIGARRSHILMQFLIEACVLSILGGLLGLGLSALGLKVFSLVADMTVSMDWRAAVSALVFCVLIGVVFGSYPAAKAGKLTPIDALQRI